MALYLAYGLVATSFADNRSTNTAHALENMQQAAVQISGRQLETLTRDLGADPSVAHMATGLESRPSRHLFMRCPAKRTFTLGQHTREITPLCFCEGCDALWDAEADPMAWTVIQGLVTQSRCRSVWPPSTSGGNAMRCGITTCGTMLCEACHFRP
jgi:hypothetical protein